MKTSVRSVMTAAVLVLVLGSTAIAETWQELLAKADSLYRADALDSALALSRQALAITEREFGGEDTASASVAALMGVVYRDQANLGQAESYLTRAIASRERAFGPEHRKVAICLRELGIVFEDQERWAEAESSYRRALAVIEKSDGPDSKSAAFCLTDLGLLFKAQSRSADAEPLLRRALEIKERVFGPRHRSVATAVNGLGMVYLDLGRLAEAEAMYNRALAIAEANSDSAGVATYAHNLGRIWVNEGRYTEAELMIRRALRIRETVFGSEHPRIVESLLLLNELLRDQNRSDEASIVTRRALVIAEKTLKPSHSMMAACLINVATDLSERGESDEAEALYQRALQTLAESVGRENFLYATCLGNLAGLYSRQQRFADAERLRREELTILTNVHGAGHPFVGECMGRLAEFCFEAGKLAEADSLFERAAEIRRQSVGEDDPYLAAISFDCAMVAERQGRFPVALRHMKHSWQIYNASFRDGVDVLSEKDALAFAVKQTASAAEYLSVLTSSASAVLDGDEVARVVLNSKGQVTDGLTARRSQTTESDPEAKALADSLQWARYAISNLYVEGPDPERPDAFQGRLRGYSLEKERLEGELARRSSRFSRTHQMWEVNATMIADALPEGGALVEFMTYEHGITGVEEGTEPRCLAVVIRSGGGSSVFPLGSASAIDSAVWYYRQQFRNIQNLDKAAYTAVSDNLYSLVWRPFAVLLSGASTVFIAPDGNLNLVSFAGLVDDDGKYLIENYPIHYLSTGRDLIRLRDEPMSGTGLLAIGDPDYDLSFSMSTASAIGTALLAGLNLRSSCEELSKLHVASLPGTRTEVSAVSKQWQQNRAEPLVTYFGSDATEEQFKRDAPGKRVIHLATHGFYITDDCKPKTGARRMIGESGGYIGENPLLQCGFLLAGANKHGEGANEASREDGIVTAEEVAGLTLQGMDLVVLSACESGLGEVKSGEGVYGLRRAFQMAGARTVISALWPVDDKSTAEFMGELFSANDETMPQTMQRMALNRITALRTQGKSDNPFSWAAFVATGDWKSK